MCLRSMTATFLSLGLLTTPSFAAPPTSDTDVSGTVRKLEKRIDHLEVQLDTQSGQDVWFNDIEISGLSEVEASKSEDFEGQNASDITLSTVELALDAWIYHDLVSAHILVLHEDDDTEPLELDEGIITIGNVNRFPLYLAAGRLYVPFGTFESQMVSDPLTLEIGETREAALQLGFEALGIYTSAYAFNGETRSGNNDKIEHFGANLGMDKELELLRFDIGLSYLNNIAESDSIQDYLAGATGTQKIKDNISAWGGHVILHMGPFTGIGEYISAVDDFAAAELPFNGSGAKPEAWNLELGYNFELWGKEGTFALGYQRTDQALSLGLPEERFLSTLSVGIFDKTTLSIEWTHDEDYGSGDTGVDAEGNPVAGTDHGAHTLTAQLAVEF